MVDGKRNLLTGVPDCATYFGDDTTNVVFYAKGQSQTYNNERTRGSSSLVPRPEEGGFFFWTRFENLAAKRWKINNRVVPILVSIRNWSDVIWLSRSEKVAEFAQCVAP